MMKLQGYIYIIILSIWSMTSHAVEPYFLSKVSITSGNYYSVFIMDHGKSNVEDLASMLQFYNPLISDQYAQKIASFYIEECSDEGVNHDIAFCQMVLETGFLNYGGSVKKSQNNFCGLGAIGEQVAGEHFPDMQIGVRAHIQHLKAYASKNDINKESVDKRFRFVERGVATTIYGLPGKWASDPLYDEKIEGLLIRLFAHRSLMASRATF